jgi:hypothetical protein
MAKVDAVEGRFWRFLGPGGYRVEVATRGGEDVQEHMMPAPQMGRGTFMQVVDESGLSVFVDTDSYDRVVEIPYINKRERHTRS